MYINEKVFNGYDNEISLKLTQAGQSIDHTTITRVRVAFTDAIVIDSVGNESLFDFTNTDKFTMKLGSLGIAAGTYSTVNLIVYTAASPLGIVWSPSLTIEVISL